MSSRSFRDIHRVQANQYIAGPPPYESWPSFGASNLPNFDTSLYQADPAAALMPVSLAPIEAPYASLNVIGEMLEAPSNINWVSYRSDLRQNNHSLTAVATVGSSDSESKPLGAQ
jgi:hypothetical protein